MHPGPVETLLSELEASKRRFGAEDARLTLQLLDRLAQASFCDAASLIRFHEAVLFVRAYPRDAELLRRSEELLCSFSERVAQLRRSGADVSAFDEMETSGIAGTVTEEVFGYDVLRSLLKRYPEQLTAVWEGYDNPARMAATLPRFIPLLEEDSLVEANVPYQEWLQAGNKGIEWLISRLESSSLPAKAQAELYEALEIPIRWELGDSPATRTCGRYGGQEVFFHDNGIMSRRDVSVAAELRRAAIPVTVLPRSEGEAVLDRARDGMAVRHRELYAFTHGDPGHVLDADLGRGVQMLLCGLPVGRRLPLRAYHGFVLYKNGIQVGYGDAVTFFERAELAFNHYYTFRQGESAWIYARVMALLHQVLGATCFSVDPYQIGFHNEEAIESGAFWFYRKLGFRPLRPDLERLVRAEEKKIASTPGHRTSARTLRRLASGHIVYELPGAAAGEWDHFHIRRLAQAAAFRGEADDDNVAAVADLLGADPGQWNDAVRAAFSNWASILSLLPDLKSWTSEEKAAAVEVVLAKAGRDEIEYVRRLLAHARLRRALLSLGSHQKMAVTAAGRPG